MLILFSLISPVFAQQTSDVVIRQVLPNPIGDDTESEWIELENTTGNTVSLSGWVLADGYGSTSSFSLDGYTIASYAFLTLFRPDTGIVLNNDTERVILTGPSGQRTQTDIMSKPAEGKAFIFQNGVWGWSDPLSHEGTQQSSPPPSSPTPISISLTTSPSITQTPSPQVLLNEVYVCSKDPEWVELKNTSNTAITLDGWSLSSNKASIMKLDGVRIDPNALYVVWLPGYYLKNKEDTMKLLEKGLIKDQFQYDSCDTHSSWSRDDYGRWYRTESISQGLPNTFQTTLTPKPSLRTKEILHNESEYQDTYTLPLVYTSSQSGAHVLGAMVQRMPVQTKQSLSPLLFLFGGLMIIVGSLIQMRRNLLPLLRYLRDTIEQI